MSTDGLAWIGVGVMSGVFYLLLCAFIFGYVEQRDIDEAPSGPLWLQLLSASFYLPFTPGLIIAGIVAYGLQEGAKKAKEKNRQLS